MPFVERVSQHVCVQWSFHKNHLKAKSTAALVEVLATRSCQTITAKNLHLIWTCNNSYCIPLYYVVVMLCIVDFYTDYKSSEPLKPPCRVIKNLESVEMRKTYQGITTPNIRWHERIRRICCEPLEFEVGSSICVLVATEVCHDSGVDS